MHDIITGSPLSKEFQIAGSDLMIGRINLELTFNYGAFGYGMERQLFERDFRIDELISYSLFPRLNPPEEEVFQNGYVIRTEAIPHPSFIPFGQKVYLSYGAEVKKKLEQLSKNIEARTSFESGMKKTEMIRKHVRNFDFLYFFSI